MDAATGPSPLHGAARIASLDAVRGIAAFVVVISHCMSVLTEQTRHLLVPFLLEHLEDRWFGLPISLRNTPFGLLVNARPAVMIFFVLSGYVLALGLLRGGPAPYRGFMVRRFCRIWLPFAASILLAALLWLALKSDALPEFNEWAMDVWSDPPTPAILASHLAMTGVHESAKSLNTPIWSLVYELRIALVFPLLMALARYPVRLVLPAALAFQLAVDAALEAAGAKTRPFFGEDALQSLLITAHFVTPFLIGILLARHAAAVGRLLGRLPAVAHAALWIAAFLLLLRWNDIPSSLGAGLIIAMVPSSATATRLLMGRAVQWLGKVSYSLYLVHMPVMMAMLHGLHAAVPPHLLILAVVPASLLAAAVMHRLVERPSIALARRLGALADQSAGALRPSGQQA